MSSADVDGPPDAKRFRIDVNTQIDVPSVSNACSIGSTPLAGEAPQEGQSPAAPSSASYRSSNGSVISSSDSPVKDEDVDSHELLLHDESEGSTVGGSSSASVGINGSTTAPCDILDMLSKTMLNNVFGGGDGGGGLKRPSGLLNTISTSPSPQSATIPGALAVAQSPAAQLFAEDDWSWHRNPAASIRSGGTNKQTPVWKYFVYNKAENLSRCIVGDCTYMLKGPHTSTLACHLKKHTKEYAEFQKLKAEYSRSKMEIQSQQPKDTIQPRPTSSPGIDLSLKALKPKKDSPMHKANSNENFNFLMSQFGGGGGNPHAVTKQTPTTPCNNMQQNQMPSMPAIMQNMMMGMNPLQMMLAHSLPTSSASNAFQQAGLSLSANGQIVQSKKWRSDDKKQREIQSRLALALETSHISMDVLQNPMWKDLFEIAQPKFNLNSLEISSYENSVTVIANRLNQSIKTMLNGAKKLNILIDVTKVTAEVAKATVAAALPAGAGNSYETQVVLLAMRNIPQSDNMAEEVARVYEQITSEYDIHPASINRVVCSGLRSVLGDEDTGNILDKQIESFGSRLLACLQQWLESSASVEAIRKALFTMLFSVITNPSALQMATKINGGKFEIPITEPFIILIETIVAMRDVFQLAHVDGFVGMSEIQWSRLTGINHICNMFKPFAGYVNDMTTVDAAIPNIQQITHALEKDVYQMGDMASDLLEIIGEKLSFVTNPDNEDFDATYIQATALNPQLAVTLSHEQMSTARRLIEKEVVKRKERRDGSGTATKKLHLGVDSILANVIKGTAAEGSIYNELFQSFGKNEKEESKENLVNQYFDEISNSTPVESLFNPLLRTFGNPMQAPLAYWKSCSSRCPELSELASELLSIPIFTLATEHVLHYSPNPSPFVNLNTNLLIANLENVEQFERQLLLRFNRSIVAKLL